jgi:multiple sugar transport system substrate-binding protein
MKKLSVVKALAMAGAMMTALPAAAQETVVWWDFLGGGDGVRMKQMISDFNEAHKGEITIDATTLEWGVPFYTKVQTAVPVGEAPDIMTYHASRIPLAVDQNLLSEITADDWSTMGLSESDYAPATWDAVTVDGKQYAVPLDTHPIVLYYNKDLLASVGRLNDDGTPMGMDSREGFTETLEALKGSGSVKFPLGSVTADGNFMFRTIYSLMGQQDGELMTDGEFLAGDNAQKLQNALSVLAEWTDQGLQSTYTDYPATVALFTSGEAAMMINGVWEVPTMTDLHKDGKLFEWGAVELPVIFDHPSTYADSHAFAIPAGDMTAEKRAAVLEVMSWISKNSLFWATAGHIPAYGPVTETAEYKAMEPNATYSPLTQNMIFDPKSTLAGIAGPIFDVMSTYFVPTLNGEMDPAEAVEEIKLELNDL